MDKPMTKSQLIAMMAEMTGMSKADTAAFWDKFVEMAISQTRSVGQFTLPGLGKLVKQERKARMGRNPATGEQISIPAKTVCKFRVAKTVKDAVM